MLEDAKNATVIGTAVATAVEVQLVEIMRSIAS
jgi:hypothetical protein